MLLLGLWRAQSAVSFTPPRPCRPTYVVAVRSAHVRLSRLVPHPPQKSNTAAARTTASTLSRHVWGRRRVRQTSEGIFVFLKV